MKKEENKVRDGRSLLSPNSKQVSIDDYMQEQEIVREAMVRRDNLLNRQTVSEKLFYSRLRNCGIVLIPQKIIFKDGLLISPVGSYYIVDFYNPSGHLVIEIDGGYHKEHFQYIRDKKRESNILEMGFNLIRFDNEEIQDLDYNKVKNFIRELSKERFDFGIGGRKFIL